MVWRIAAASFVFGFLFGFFDGGQDLNSNAEKGVLLAATACLVLVVAYEGYRFYRRSDELVKHIFDRSLAIGGLIILSTTLLYGMIDIVFELPEISVLHLGLYMLAVKSAAWMVTAWRTS